MKKNFWFILVFLLLSEFSHGSPLDLKPEDFKGDDKKDGKEFSENGVQYRIVNRAETKGILIKKDSGWKKHGMHYKFNSQGVLIEKTPYVEGKIHGLQEKFSDNGQRTIETPYSEGLKNGVEKSYRDDGRCYQETPYTAGNREGKEIKYTPFDTASVKRMVKEFEYNWVKNKKHGEVLQFNKNGTIVSREFFQNDNKVGDTIYLK